MIMYSWIFLLILEDFFIENLFYFSVSDPETRVEMEIVDMNIDCREGLVMVSVIVEMLLFK